MPTQPGTADLPQFLGVIPDLKSPRKKFFFWPTDPTAAAADRLSVRAEARLINYLFNLFLDFFLVFFPSFCWLQRIGFVLYLLAFCNGFFFIIYQLYYLIVISYNPDFTYNIQWSFVWVFFLYIVIIICKFYYHFALPYMCVCLGM